MKTGKNIASSKNTQNTLRFPSIKKKTNTNPLKKSTESSRLRQTIRKAKVEINDTSIHNTTLNKAEIMSTSNKSYKPNNFSGLCKTSPSNTTSSLSLTMNKNNNNSCANFIAKRTSFNKNVKKVCIDLENKSNKEEPVLNKISKEKKILRDSKSNSKNHNKSIHNTSSDGNNQMKKKNSCNKLHIISLEGLGENLTHVKVMKSQNLEIDISEKKVEMLLNKEKSQKSKGNNTKKVNPNKKDSEHHINSLNSNQNRKANCSPPLINKKNICFKPNTTIKKKNNLMINTNPIISPNYTQKNTIQNNSKPKNFKASFTNTINKHKSNKPSEVIFSINSFKSVFKIKDEPQLENKEISNKAKEELKTLKNKLDSIGKDQIIKENIKYDVINAQMIEESKDESQKILKESNNKERAEVTNQIIKSSQNRLKKYKLLLNTINDNYKQIQNLLENKPTNDTQQNDNLIKEEKYSELNSKIDFSEDLSRNKSISKNLIVDHLISPDDLKSSEGSNNILTMQDQSKIAFDKALMTMGLANDITGSMISDTIRINSGELDENKLISFISDDKTLLGELEQQGEESCNVLSPLHHQGINMIYNSTVKCDSLQRERVNERIVDFNPEEGMINKLNENGNEDNKNCTIF
ncbi:MAG: hypothetical protein MJ252_04590 [archaeon]|nr:hypothetical protein [archaeon]